MEILKKVDWNIYESINNIYKAEKLMEEAQNKQSKLQEILETIKNTTFNTILELLKEKKAGTAIP